jgi:hypothetical protein
MRQDKEQKGDGFSSGSHAAHGNQIKRIWVRAKKRKRGQNYFPSHHSTNEKGKKGGKKGTDLISKMKHHNFKQISGITRL